MRKVVSLVVIVMLSVITLGCGRSPPQIVEGEGVLTLDGKPLPHATVHFTPQLQDWGADFDSSAVTDDQGKFVLICHNTGTAGVAVATHVVTISEGPLPAEARSLTNEGMMIGIEFRKKLQNRPIPAQYANIVESPLKVEVKPDQKLYELNLVR